VEEYEVDTAILKEIRAIQEQVAKELGSMSSVARWISLWAWRTWFQRLAVE